MLEIFLLILTNTRRIETVQMPLNKMRTGPKECNKNDWFLIESPSSFMLINIRSKNLFPWKTNWVFNQSWKHFDCYFESLKQWRNAADQNLNGRLLLQGYCSKNKKNCWNIVSKQVLGFFTKLFALLWKTNQLFSHFVSVNGKSSHNPKLLFLAKRASFSSRNIITSKLN